MLNVVNTARVDLTPEQVKAALTEYVTKNSNLQGKIASSEVKIDPNNKARVELSIDSNKPTHTKPAATKE